MREKGEHASESTPAILDTIVQFTITTYIIARTKYKTSN